MIAYQSRWRLSIARPTILLDFMELRRYVRPSTIGMPVLGVRAYLSK